MKYERSALRYAHTNGHTGLIYTESGDFIITCGSDGDIRRWTCISDDDPTSNCLGEFVVCLAHRGERLFASTDRHTVQIYTFPELDKDGIVFRFTALVTCLRVTGKYKAAGSEDTFIKVLIDGNEEPMELTGHTGPVLALDICESRDLLASVAGDGQLKIWNLENDTGTEVKSIGGLAKVNSFENTNRFGTPSFEPTLGNELAYVHGKEVVVLNTSSWDVAYTLSDENITSNYSCCQFSTDGRQLAAGTTSGELSIFNVKHRKALKVEAPTNECKGITCIAWSTVNNEELAFCDSSGQLGTIFTSDGAEINGSDDVEYEQDGPIENGFFDDVEFENGDGMINNEAYEADINGGDGGDDDDETGSCVSLEKLKQKVMSNATKTVRASDYDDTDSRHSVHSSELPSEVVPVVKTFNQQSAFQPGSTPLELDHRYLVWNEVGIVTAHTDGSADGSIDVEFHDSSIHNSLHITNYQGHNMASLSSTALALTSIDSTKLVVIALAASGNKEWSIGFPDCESVEALVATSKLIGVATSSHFLRLFTVMGTQREIISIPGPVVALTGHEYSILVVYHSAPAATGQQYLAAMLIQTCGLSMHVQQLPLPLTPGNHINWVGFSDCGSPAFSDNMGLIQLYRLKSNAWFPICDTVKQSASVSHNYFVISISERTQIIQAVLCRACSYPMTNPRPMLQELRMQLPLCDIEDKSEKAELEDILMRAAIMQIDGSDKLIKETAIKLFALACRSESEARAKELIETISCTDLLQLAVKYASKLGRIHLSDRLCELVPQLEMEQEIRKQKDLLNSNAIIQPIYVPVTPNSSSSMRLAPKPMEMSATRRGTLKRFAQGTTGGNNSPSLLKSFLGGGNGSTPKSSENDSRVDTQENVFEDESQLEQTSTSSLTKGERDQSSIRTPLNSMNPFASKRKLTETGVIFGSEKLKIAKK